mmetsp:Transcript_46738/g.113897  ORF Transcript_46738/g.113897 Transcript_46738/m.113897 type:complete len:506 (-) Transcript_46738:98-1615(-)
MSSTKTRFSFTAAMMGSLAFVLLTVLVVSPSDTEAFQHVAVHHRSHPTTHTGGRSRSASRLAVVPPPVAEIDSLVNHLVASTSTVTDLDAATSASVFTSSFSQLLADAAAATADAATDAATQTDGGWWKAYLNIFKTAIEAVHNTIDPPLRSVGFTQTWGVSIALFTAGVRSLLIPLSIQQSKSSEYIKLLKPYTTEIKEKFKDNEDARNRATAKLYEDANQNPLSGCLLSLAQLPIFLGLYRGVRLLALDGKLEEPFLWIPSLQGPVTAETDFRGLDWLTQGWQQIDGTWTPALGWETTLAFCVMPVLLVLGQSLTMNALQPPPDEDASDEEREQLEKTQGILKFLPLMIGFFSLQVPAGLTIYWFTSNGFTLTQSLLVRKYYELNPPEINLPDYWESLDKMEEMSADEKRKAAAAGLAVGPKFEDLIVESNFHTVIERTPLRADSAAWQRVASANGEPSGAVPAQMEAWVGSMNGSSSASPSQTNGGTATQEQEAATAVPTSA